MPCFPRTILPTTFAAIVFIWAGVMAHSAERAKLEAFMNITGFDVALDSMRLSAGAAPEMLGLKESDFGSDWTRLADTVFAPHDLRTQALDILEATLSDEALTHVADFYSSDLGQKLVAAENQSHMADDDIKAAEGQREAARLMQEDPNRIELYKQMTDSIGSLDQTIKSINEVQVRFLLSAMQAGILDWHLDEADLRNILAVQQDEMRLSITAHSIAGNSYTYRNFTDDEINRYIAALRAPLMQEVYELMNAVQFTIMAGKYEELAFKMAQLHPSEEL